MSMIRCTQGHFYDPEQHSTCPYCGVDITMGDQKTERVRATERDASSSGSASGTVRTPDEGRTIRRGAAAPPSAGGDQKTIRISPGGEPQSEGGADPVVGWLVCIDGPDRGRSYIVYSGRNAVGRGKENRIMISGDRAISRSQHAVVIYDPRGNAFKVAPGTTTAELTYLNGESVDVPTRLSAHDVLEMGKSKLLFVPLCGDQFRWDDVQESS